MGDVAALVTEESVKESAGHHLRAPSSSILPLVTQHPAEQMRTPMGML